MRSMIQDKMRTEKTNRKDDESDKRRMKMAVKVMGITCGRKNSNSEVLLKEALMYCEETGADLSLIHI